MGFRWAYPQHACKTHHDGAEDGSRAEDRQPCNDGWFGGFRAAAPRHAVGRSGSPNA